jgi:hypothetical protein
MKTKIYLVSIMALTFGITSNGQNANTSARQPETDLSANAPANDNKRILVRLGGKTVPDNLDAETPLAVKTANISGESDRNELLKLAEALAYQAKRLRNEANTKSGSEKSSLLAEADLFEKNCLMKQIEASEIFGAMSQVKFNSNKVTINKLIDNSQLEEKKLHQTRFLISASEKNMQLAKELRQEAYAFTNMASRLGTMGNAEEKEVLALNAQSEAIDLLGKKKNMN